MNFINLHCHRTEQQFNEYRIYNRYTHENKPLGLYSSGIHPWRLEKWEDQFEQLEKIVVDENCIAIGECGLDRVIETDIEYQIPIFEKQLILAELIKKPIIVHCVKAFDILLHLLKKHKISVPIISHGYKNKPEQLEQLIKAGVKVSFGKAIFLENSTLPACLNRLSLHDFFLETDNSPDILIEQVYEKASEITGYTVEELKIALFQNFRDIFPHAKL